MLAARDRNIIEIYPLQKGHAKEHNSPMGCNSLVASRYTVAYNIRYVTTQNMASHETKVVIYLHESPATS